MTRVRGHGLVAEGAPHTALGVRVTRGWVTTGGPGHARCQCGVVSEQSYDTGAARKRWHREHKAEVAS